MGSTPLMTKEPYWRVVLNWGCIMYFLGLPAIAILFGLLHVQVFPSESHAPQFLANFHLSISALVAAMAGLNSFDRYKNGKQETKT
jgi:hypothetical protein